METGASDVGRVGMPTPVLILHTTRDTTSRTSPSEPEHQSGWLQLESRVRHRVGPCLIACTRYAVHLLWPLRQQRSVQATLLTDPPPCVSE